MLVLLISLIMGAGPAYSGSSSSRLQSWCEGHLTFCMTQLMQFRCWQYSEYAPISTKELRCESASSYLTRSAELEIEPKYGMPIIFSKKLLLLGKKSETSVLLTELNQKMQKALEDRTRFSVWEFFLSKFSLNKIRALEFMSTIFQDNTSDRVYPEFAGIPELNDVFERIGLIPLQKIDSLEKLFLRVYPNIDSSNLNQNFYHFYSSAYFAARLKQAGFEPRLASFVSFMFGAMYEFSEIPSKNWPWSDPERINPKKHAWKIRDLYQSYLGALFGIDEKRLMSFEVFNQKITADPKSFMKILYN